MSHLVLKKSIVSVDWLNRHKNEPNLVILDASMPKAFTESTSNEREYITEALEFDIKCKFSDRTAKYPNTYPSKEQFQSEARHLGINNNSAIIVYDDKGIYSSARAWWLFKSFGHHNIAVLDGGLPEWQKSGFEITTKLKLNTSNGDFEAKTNPDFMVFHDTLQELILSENHCILDARSSDRFNGLIAEPRNGLRSGTIPNSINLPFTSLLENGKLKTTSELNVTFSKLVQKNNHLVFSCGSGITACVLALAADISGYKNLSVYDGSWTEYGSLNK